MSKSKKVQQTDSKPQTPATQPDGNEGQKRTRFHLSRKQGIILSLVVVLLAAGGITLGLLLSQPSGDPFNELFNTIHTVDSAKAEQYTITNANGSITLYMSMGTWKVRGLENASIDSTVLEELQMNVFTLKSYEVIATNRDNLAEYGLENPSATVEIRMDDGTIHHYSLGNATVDQNAYYLILNDDPNVYRVLQSIGFSFLRKLDDLHTLPTLGVESQEICYVRIERKGLPTIMGDRAVDPITNMEDIYFTEPFQRGANMQVIMDSVAAPMINVKAHELVAYQPSDLKKYGLDDPSAKIFLRDNNGNSFNLTVGDAKPDTEYTYCMVNQYNAVYLFDNTALTWMSIQPLDIMYIFVAPVNITTIESLHVTGFGRDDEFTFSRQESVDSNGNPVYDSTTGERVIDNTVMMNGKQVQYKAFSKAYRILIDHEISGAVDETKLDKNATPVLTLTYKRNRDPEELVVKYVPYDNDYYAAEVNGKYDVFIQKSILDPIAEKLDALSRGQLND